MTPGPPPVMLQLLEFDKLDDDTIELYGCAGDSVEDVAHRDFEPEEFEGPAGLDTLRARPRTHVRYGPHSCTSSARAWVGRGAVLCVASARQVV